MRCYSPLEAAEVNLIYQTRSDTTHFEYPLIFQNSPPPPPTLSLSPSTPCPSNATATLITLYDCIARPTNSLFLPLPYHAPLSSLMHTHARAVLHPASLNTPVRVMVVIMPPQLFAPWSRVASLSLFLSRVFPRACGDNFS